MFYIVVNKKDRVYAIVPQQMIQWERLPQGFEVSSYHESKQELAYRAKNRQHGIEGKYGFRRVEIRWNEQNPRFEDFEVTKTDGKGVPAIWESGGRTSSNGKATVVCGPNGEKKTALRIRRKGHLANEHHALLVLNVGDFIIHVRTNYCEVKLAQVLKVVGFVEKVRDGFLEEYLLLGADPSKLEKRFFARCEVVADVRNGAWLPAEVPEFLQTAYKAAVSKANKYHCRERVYAIDPHLGY